MSRIIDRVRASGNWSPDTSDDAIWNDTVQYFQTRERHERRKVIDTVREEHLPHGVTVNRETADTLNRLQQLQEIDAALWNAGR
jgi:hypothetical protein